jgi:putative transposase
VGHTYCSLYQHIAFSTKRRAKVLSVSVQPRLFAYMAGVVNNKGCRSLVIGGHTDHVHLLLSVRAAQVPSELVKEVKRASSIWLKTKGDELRDFAWQAGYGVFSVSYSKLGNAKAYIAGQAERHRKMTWDEEFRTLLVKHGIEFDERYYLD